MELESKLAAYRLKKKREAKIQGFKENFKNLFRWKTPQKKNLEDNTTLESETSKILSCDHSKTNIIDKKQNKILNKCIYATGFIFWVYLYYIFITLQFGIVYLIISALFGIYFNTRTGPKNVDEISAYSVFNKNCESINGTLKAEHFEREIRFGGQLAH